ncbi:MAG TPA: copper amine oxidase N-terminal domain-containing protein [Acetivibrio sp.]|nr:copper amine oxidase N-terminal domain-containing protein [Acetivibrio sp.]
MKRMADFFSYALVFCILITFSLTSVVSFAAQDEINVVLNGTKLEFDVKPYIKNGRTMVPFRGIFEALGVEVSWDGVNRSVLATNDTTQIFIEIGKDYAFVNGYRIDLDAAPEIINGRTFVPLRFVSENAGADVSWDGHTRTVYINYIDEKHEPGEIAYYRELEFTIDRVESEADGKLLKVYGRTNTAGKTLVIEVYDSSRRFSSGLAKVTKKEEEVYVFQAEILVESSFEPKFIIVKTISDQKKLIKISQFDL